MSKTTQNTTLVKPMIYGGLFMALAVLTAAAITKRLRENESVESLLKSCEHALGRLDERTTAAVA